MSEVPLYDEDNEGLSWGFSGERAAASECSIGHGRGWRTPPAVAAQGLVQCGAGRTGVAVEGGKTLPERFLSRDRLLGLVARSTDSGNLVRHL